MKSIILIISMFLLSAGPSFAQQQVQKSAPHKAQSQERMYFRGFSKTGDLNKELTKEEVEKLHELISNDSSAAQIQQDFDHPGKELKPLVDKLSKETKETLVKSAQFSPGPKSVNKKQ